MPEAPVDPVRARVARARRYASTLRPPGRALPAARGPSARGLIFVLAGATAVVTGGFVAAATSVTPSAHGAWAAAYLVLVVGVAQILLGIGQAYLVRADAATTALPFTFACWNLGNLAVIGGVFLNLRASVDGGSAILLVALGTCAWTTRQRQPGPRLIWIGYRLVLVILALSVPAGALLARSLAT